jgi:hypothetical protein
MVSFIFIKSIDIMYVVAIQFLVAILLNIPVDRLLKKVDIPLHENDPNNYTFSLMWKEIVKVVVAVCILAVVSYFGRLMIRSIPSPFDGISGLKHLKLKEIQSASALTAFLFLTSDYLDARIQVIRKIFAKLIV